VKIGAPGPGCAACSSFDAESCAERSRAFGRSSS
jgi:hypothetical protein